MDWLDSWTKTRKLPETFKAAMRYAGLHRGQVSQSPEGNRISRPVMTWQETKAWLLECSKKHDDK